MSQEGTLSLFPHLIEQVGQVTHIRDIRGSAATLVVDGVGRKWVRKRVGDYTIGELVAEATAWAFGHRLGAPLPRAGFSGSGDDRSWLSQYVVPQHWDPKFADLVVNVDELGCLLAVDAIVHNGDRHTDNLLVQPAPDTQRVRVVGIDFGIAAISDPRRLFELGRRAVPKLNDHYCRRLPWEAWEYAMDAASEACRFPRSELLAVARDASLVSGTNVTKDVAEALLRRCRSARHLVKAHLATAKRYA